MILTTNALGNLVYLALACALVAYGDWKYRRSGARGLWRDWVILATVLTGAFAAASVVFYGPGHMEPSPLWAPIPVVVGAGSIHLLHRRRWPTGVRIPLTALLFFAVQQAGLWRCCNPLPAVGMVRLAPDSVLASTYTLPRGNHRTQPRR